MDNMQRWVEDIRVDELIVNGKETVIVLVCPFFL
jgi:hypothetical protein